MGKFIYRFVTKPSFLTTYERYTSVQFIQGKQSPKTRFQVQTDTTCRLLVKRETCQVIVIESTDDRVTLLVVLPSITRRASSNQLSARSDPQIVI